MAVVVVSHWCGGLQGHWNAIWLVAMVTGDMVDDCHWHQFTHNIVSPPHCSGGLQRRMRTTMGHAMI